MPLQNQSVIEHFVAGDTGYDGYGAVKSTEGGVLYSYSAKIAEWTADGTIRVYDGWDGYSRTTSKHFKFLHGALAETASAEWEATHEPTRKGSHKSRWY